MGCAIGQARGSFSAPGRFKRVAVGWKSCHKGMARVRQTPLPRLGAFAPRWFAEGEWISERGFNQSSEAGSFVLKVADLAQAGAKVFAVG
jgi:hypothetical protein